MALATYQSFQKRIHHCFADTGGRQLLTTCSLDGGCHRVLIYWHTIFIGSHPEKLVRLALFLNFIRSFLASHKIGDKFLPFNPLLGGEGLILVQLICIVGIEAIFLL